MKAILLLCLLAACTAHNVKIQGFDARGAPTVVLTCKTEKWSIDVSTYLDCSDGKNHGYGYDGVEATSWVKVLP